MGGLILVLGLLIASASKSPMQSADPAVTAIPLGTLLQQTQGASPLLLRQMLLAMGMTLVCTLIHLMISGVVATGYQSPALLHWASRSSLRRLVLIAGTALLTFLAMVLEIIAWAVLFLRQGAVSNLEQGLYFSSVTFASLGYGDITLPIPFHLLASLEALVGILMADWSTALLEAVAQKYLTLKVHRQAGASDSFLLAAP